MKEFLDIRGPQPPPPGEADLASFRALQKHFERVNGFQFPESEAPPAMGFDSRRTRREIPRPSWLRDTSDAHEKVHAYSGAGACDLGDPHNQGTWVDNSTDPAVRETAAVYSAALMALTQRQAKAFESGVPTARVVRLLGANHYVYLSTEADVLRELHAFLAGLS